MMFRAGDDDREEMSSQAMLTPFHRWAVKLGAFAIALSMGSIFH